MPRIHNVGGVRPQQFLYVPAISNKVTTGSNVATTGSYVETTGSNIVTTGNGTGTKNVLKWKCVLGFVFSIQSSVYGATTVAKVYLGTVYCKFLLYVSVEINPFSCEQTLVI